MANPNKHSEAHKKPASHEVQSFIDKKKHERADRISAEVTRKMQGTKEGVADIMGGIESTETPKDYVSEKKGESGEQRDIKGGGGGKRDDSKFVSQIPDSVLPSEQMMVRRVRIAIKMDIERELKRAFSLQGSLKDGSAQEFNSSIARIRSLKEVLASLFTATFSFIKDLYLKYFTVDGRRRGAGEV
jgi:hypothetical protein